LMYSTQTREAVVDIGIKSLFICNLKRPAECSQKWLHNQELLGSIAMTSGVRDIVQALKAQRWSRRRFRRGT
jgi:hypothetical protein